MPRQRTEVRKIRQSLQHHFEDGYSDRYIAELSGISHPTVKKIRMRVLEAGHTWPLPDELDDVALEQLCFSPVQSYVGSRPLPDWSDVWTQMQRKGTTLLLVWQRYRDNNPSGLEYSRFCELYRHWRGKRKISMHQSHHAGEKTFVDYAGQTMELVDPSTGERKNVQVFVASAGVSGRLYAEATLTAGSRDWIESHIRMFEYFGGATEILIPDNLKTGVDKACRYDPDINITYRNMARHYGTVVIPARVRKPRDKSMVENGVQQVERWIIAVLRDRVFFTLEELNAAIWAELEKINAKPFNAREGSRDSVFKEVDRPCLKRLPSERFAYEEWQKVKVHLDHHIQVQYNYYSVPWKLVGMTLLARLTGRTVELFHNERRVASHARSYGRGKWSTCEEHMPPSHESCLKMTPEKIMQWASETGEKTALLAQEILGRKDHPQQGYRAIIGIMGFGKKYGIERLDAACGVALRLNALRFRDVKHILEAGLEAGVTDGREEEEPIMHENIRGADYYRGGEEC